MKIFVRNNCILNIMKILFLYLFIFWIMYGKVLIVFEECFVVIVILLVLFFLVGYLWDDLFFVWLIVYWFYDDVMIDLYEVCL